ncbi:ABC transporter permease [Azospirillum argentinense]|uniref:ABC transporter permease n=1 Tax=Azospirillum argentinense TaxID=2970906 RepID=A0A4D8PDG1_9PROT|nr:ABC transporter substrate-binding protein [Azospirillum argentinense]QCN95220.1 ABC transporter permease [Azospirillum argentinense]
MAWRAPALAAVALAVVLLCTPVAAAPEPPQGAQFFPHLVYRSGPYAPYGIPLADGVADYLTLVNRRDGGIGGVPIAWEECDTGYNTDRGVDCYERLKAKGPTGAAAVLPLSTGITYALIERGAADRIPVFSSGYGRADVSDGRVFPYAVNAPASYWTGIDAAISHIAAELGGTERLRGRKIAYVYHDSAFGKEPLPMLEALRGPLGFEMRSFPVAPPGLDQRAVWTQIARHYRPDYVILWGWGVQNSTALREAAAAGYPADRMIGVWWAGSELDVRPVGAAAVGYKAVAFHAAGSDLPVIRAIREQVHARGLGAGDPGQIGTVLYNRGVFNAAVLVEAIRTAQSKYGRRPLTGAQVAWGFDHLDLTADRLAALGLDGFMQPLRITCADHEGIVPLHVQQWDGERWLDVSGPIEPRRTLIRKLVTESARRFAAERKIEPRACD